MVLLTGRDLTIEQIRSVVYNNETVSLDPEAVENITKNRSFLEQKISKKEVMYGINTGFGKFSDVVIEEKDLEMLQRNLIHSHACGVGEPFSEAITRTMLLLRANNLTQGYSGVRVEVVNQLLACLNAGIHPVVPQKGSLGASGDLAPLSHIALALLGEGEVVYQGVTCSAGEALNDAGIQPITLQAKEGLALINGTQAMTAVGVAVFIETEQILYQSESIACMTMEGLEAIIDAFDPDLHILRPHKEQVAVASRMCEHLHDSKLITRQGEKRMQDAYAIRCIPQVLGASWQTVVHLKEKLEIEINAVTDNPLVLMETDKVLSGGNFHGQPIAFAMDYVKLGIAEAANISERRIERLVNPQLNDLPPFLSANPGLESGAMIMQYSAASLVSENKTLAHPASVDSIPSSANQEDHVSMGTIGARHAYEMLQNTRMVIAIEFICAMQAVEFQGVEKMSSQTKSLYDMGRSVVPTITEDRIFSKDMKNMCDWLLKETFQ